MEILLIVLVLLVLLAIASKRKPAESARIINDQNEQKKQEQTDELITVILPTIDNDKSNTGLKYGVFTIGGYANCRVVSQGKFIQFLSIYCVQLKAYLQALVLGQIENSD